MKTLLSFLIVMVLMMSANLLAEGEPSGMAPTSSGPLGSCPLAPAAGQPATGSCSATVNCQNGAATSCQLSNGAPCGNLNSFQSACLGSTGSASITGTVQSGNCAGGLYLIYNVSGGGEIQSLTGGGSGITCTPFTCQGRLSASGTVTLQITLKQTPNFIFSAQATYGTEVYEELTCPGCRNTDDPPNRLQDRWYTSQVQSPQKKSHTLVLNNLPQNGLVDITVKTIVDPTSLIPMCAMTGCPAGQTCMPSGICLQF